MTRSLAKTATFAIVHYTVAFSIAYALTGSVPVAGAIALLEPVANALAYFVHERLWERRGGAPAPATGSARALNAA